MPTFKVEGVRYPMVGDDLTLDEAGWFWRIAGVGIEALADDELGDRTLKLTALMCISIAREQPLASQGEIQKLVGSLKLTDLEDVFEDEPGEQSPPASRSDEPPASTGEPSSGASEYSPAEPEQASTGLPPSDTGATSDLETSVGLRRIS